MNQIKTMTYKEILSMYDKCEKIELIQMLIEANDQIARLTKPNDQLHAIMQAEGSANSDGAAVGNSAVGKGVCGGECDCQSPETGHVSRTCPIHGGGH